MTLIELDDGRPFFNRIIPTNHRIILDQSALVQFIDWLPDLDHNEAYFLCLQTRKKYFPDFKSSHERELRRFVANKKNMLEKIKQLECPVGSYLTKDGEIIPDDAMVLYITLNPRDIRKATYDAISALSSLALKQVQNPECHLHPHSEVLSCIHRAKSKTRFVHFDVDRPVGSDRDNFSPKNNEPISELYSKVIEIVDKESVTVIETRGGCHFLIDPKKVSNKKNWFLEVKNVLKADQSGDLMVPVVACGQGGFTPRFYKP